MLMRFAIVLGWLVLLVSGSSAEEARLLRFPHVSHDKVVFVYAGDLYTAPRAGGDAVRLTSHQGLELFPRFSPDGSHIAFTGHYDGDASVYVMPTAGGPPRRLTYHPAVASSSERFGPENVVMGWHPDGSRVLFRSRKEVNDIWDGRAYLVDTAGGLPRPLPMAVAGFTSLNADADKVAYCPIYRDFRTWKRYKGGMAQDVWTFDFNTMESQKITDWVGTDNLPMWFGDKIYFNSDRTGTLNLFCYDLSDGTTRQVTEYDEYDVRWPSLGVDGIAFENGGYLYVMDLPSETVRKVEVRLAVDLAWMRPSWVTVDDNIRDYDLSPDGNRAVFAARGELFTVPAKNGNTRNLTGHSSGSLEKEPVWSPDGKWIAFISDRTGEDEIYVVSPGGDTEIQLTSGGDIQKYGMKWSPDSKSIAWSDPKRNLWVVSIESKEIRRVDHWKRNELRDFDWSPDSRYLAYTKRGVNRISKIWIWDSRTEETRAVTPGFTNDHSPAFSPDGQYLYFLSERDFNPILGDYEFSFVNESITNLFLIVLSADSTSPFAPTSDEVEANEGDKDKRESKSDDGGDVVVTIDFDGIFDREVAFDLPAGNYRGLTAVDNAVFYTSNPIRGLRGRVTQNDRDLHKYDIEDKEDKVFASNVGGYRIPFGSGKMLLSRQGSFYIVDTKGSKADFDDTRINLTGMETLVDRRAEYQQMFDNVWRRFRDFFYDSSMHGVDWTAMRERYGALLPHVNHRFDLIYVIGEMIGELACSHTYVGGGDYFRGESSQVGLLGANLEIDEESNRIQFSRILYGENWDNRLRNPLTEPGVEVSQGDYLLAIDGVEITAEINPYRLLVQKADRTVQLTVNAKPTLDGARTVTIEPLSSEVPIRYYDWVEQRRRYVDSVSEGTIGYIHIPDMDSYGLVRFTRMFYNQLRRPGLIIDVRYNGGGFVSGLILERLRRVVVAMGMSRHGTYGPSPGDAINAHMVTLCNEFSCSDGDIFPYFFREYGLGPLVGKRTWGGVIGIRGGGRLSDGGYAWVPEFGMYGTDGTWIMENHGVEPDYVVENEPGRLIQGYDDQLDWAIDYIQKKLIEEPKEFTPIPDPPGKR